MWDVISIIGCFALAICPPHLDPAVRLKIWIEFKRKK